MKTVKDLRTFKIYYNSCVNPNGPKSPQDLTANPKSMYIKIYLSTGAVSPKGAKAMKDVLHTPSTYLVSCNVDADIPFSVHPDSNPK